MAIADYIEIGDVNSCDTVFHANQALFKIPIVNYKNNVNTFGLSCSVYRSDVMPLLEGLNYGYIYEYYFNYNTKFFEWLIDKSLAEKVAKHIIQVGKRYNPSGYLFCTDAYLKNMLNVFYNGETLKPTLDFLRLIGNLLHNFEILPTALSDLGYTYIRKGVSTSDSLKGGKRGIHYDILVLQPQELRLKKLLQITDNALNGVLDLTPIINTLAY